MVEFNICKCLYQVFWGLLIAKFSIGFQDYKGLNEIVRNRLFTCVQIKGIKVIRGFAALRAPPPPPSLQCFSKLFEFNSYIFVYIVE